MSDPASETEELEPQEELDDQELPEESDEPVDEEAEAQPARVSVPAAAPRPAATAGGLTIYKPGQGYYTRMGTVVGGGALLLWGIAWVHEKLGVFANRPGGIYLQNAPIVALFFAVAAALYWVVGRNRRCGDFMIATESEMKKVSWSSKKEIIGSTKVVLGAVVLIAVVLFLVDVGFRLLFAGIGVLRFPGAGK